MEKMRHSRVYMAKIVGDARRAEDAICANTADRRTDVKTVEKQDSVNMVDVQPDVKIVAVRVDVITAQMELVLVAKRVGNVIRAMHAKMKKSNHLLFRNISKQRNISKMSRD